MSDILAKIDAERRSRLARRALDDSLPFVATRFAEHMEETVEKAKVEVHSYIAASIHRAGLAAIAAPMAGGPLALPNASGETQSADEAE